MTPRVEPDVEPERCLRCGHWEHKHWKGKCEGMYYDGPNDEVRCACKGFLG